MITPFKRDMRLRGKTPHVIQERRSYSLLVRDGILDRIKAMPFFSTFSFGSNTAVPLQQQSLPYCGVYLLQEQMTPDGDANTGEVRFRTTARIGLSVIVKNNDFDAAEIQLDKAYQSLTIGLFSDPSLYNNSVFKIQAFSNGVRQHVFGNMTKDNETPIAELRLEISCDLGVITYPPDIIDDLEIIHVTTAFPVGGTAQEIHDTQQVEAEYDIDQNPS